MSEDDIQGAKSVMQPDDTVPSEERQAELRAGCEANQNASEYRRRVFPIRTRGELLWLIREQGWSGEVDDQRQHRAQLCAVNFSRANLQGVHLYMASLQDSYFRETDLSGAILIGAHLLDVSLEDANLRGAHLAGAYLCA